MVIDARLAGLGISKTADLRFLTQDGPKMRKYLVSNSCVDEKHLISEET